MSSYDHNALDRLYDSMLPPDSIYAEVSVFVHQKGEPPAVEIEYNPIDTSFTFRLRRRGFAITTVRMNASQYRLFHDNFEVQSLQAMIERDTAETAKGVNQ
jgi:hypothetical protein